ncbi:MAG: sulfatase-like hydrolase/transferase [Verrucomicrobiales bacterium]|nr:sulfatase-like hydrolase/transferase [Verrucomicrobiales bacterium]
MIRRVENRREDIACGYLRCAPVSVLLKRYDERRNALSTAVVLLASVLLGIASAADHPNVVFILSDDQGWEDYGFMGNEVVQTPHLDALAVESRLYKKGYVVAPLCRPSLASMVTGLHPHQHGVVGNDVTPARKLERDAEDRPVRAAFHEHESLIRFLVDRGYLAHQSGKWWEGTPADGGFTHGMTHGDPAKGGRHGDVGLKIGREGIAPVEAFIDHAQAEEKPFFLWYAPFLPHTPHNPPADILARYEGRGLTDGTAKYYAMCEWFDQTCGELVTSIERRGLRENTLIVYICDNGWLAADNSGISLPEGWWPGYAPKSKGSPYELGIRTPIFFSWPGQIEPAEQEGFASSLDLFPTIASLCGFEAPEGLPGIDLMEATRGSVKGAAYSIHNMTPGNPFETLQYSWMREGDWKFLRRHDGSDTTKYLTVHDWDRVPVQLFNLSQDPDETTNLADQHPEVVSRFQTQLNELFPQP